MRDVRLLYVSTVANDFDPSELDNILASARERNGREGVSGVLFFTSDSFVQCLEGSVGSVNALYGDLMRDPRHHDLILLSYGEITARMFSSWQMAYISPGEISEEILQEHSIGRGCSPDTIDEAAATDMLRLLVSHIEA